MGLFFIEYDPKSAGHKIQHVLTDQLLTALDDSSVGLREPRKTVDQRWKMLGLSVNSTDSADTFYEIKAQGMDPIKLQNELRILYRDYYQGHNVFYSETQVVKILDANLMSKLSIKVIYESNGTIIFEFISRYLELLPRSTFVLRPYSTNILYEKVVYYDINNNVVPLSTQKVVFSSVNVQEQTHVVTIENTVLSDSPVTIVRAILGPFDMWFIEKL